MALKKPDSQKAWIQNKFSDHDQYLEENRKDIKEQQQLTKFFVIVVAATLVSILVGLGGLYISAFKNTASKAEVEKIFKLQEDVNNYKFQLELIKVKNPYLKY